MGVWTLRACFDSGPAFLPGFIAVAGSLCDGNLSSVYGAGAGRALAPTGPDHSHGDYCLAVLDERGVGRARDSRTVLGYG